MIDHKGLLVCCAGRERELVRGSAPSARGGRGGCESWRTSGRINPLAGPRPALRPLALQAESETTPRHAQVNSSENAIDSR